MRRIGSIAAVLVVAAMCLWWVRSSFAAPTGMVAEMPAMEDRGAETAESVGADTTPAPPKSNTTSTAPASSDVRQPAGSLHVEARDLADEPVGGPLRWFAAADPVRARRLLTGDLRDSQRETLQAAGLELPCEPWHWVAVRHETTGAAELVPPSGGHRHVVLRVGRSTFQLCTYVWTADLRRPAPGAELRLWSLSNRTRGPARTVDRATTDEYGMARFGDLDPGRYIVTAGDAAPEQAGPHRAVATLGPSGSGDAAVELAVPAPEVDVTLTVVVAADADDAQPLRPKLLLRRRDDDSGDVKVSDVALRPGLQRLTMRVPAGEYTAGVLPLGAYDLVSGGVVRAGGDGEPETIHLRATPHTHLRLEGMDWRRPPYRVYPQRAGQAHVGDPSLEFCGPWSWFRPEDDVHLPAGDLRLVVSSRHMHWIAETTIRRGGNASVQLVPGCRLVLLRSAGDGVPEPLIAEVSSAVSRETVQLNRSLAADLRRGGVWLRGTVVVPASTIVIQPLGGGFAATERSLAHGTEVVILE